LRVGGVADHVHIVTTLPRTLSQAEMIETLKKTSSKWIKGLDSKYRRFYWQRGYGAFSVSPSQLDAVFAQKVAILLLITADAISLPDSRRIREWH